ncbi:hypothetical protein L9F63_007673 [Diploptera punctata]|uniref:Peptidase S1 domain-containing protein n=1 Tax=Diploptera punctata TaxID=6984 RepID=A0AAD7Z8L9_DIPPU|nr:hypothetical protein L9F63_007673 [Diploptera punctata]
MDKFCMLSLLTVGLLHDAFCNPQVERSIEMKRQIGVQHVFGGRLALPSEFPHLAAIGFIRRFKLHWLCGGTLINERFVLTAAHCLEDNRYRAYGKAVRVRLGDIDLKSSADDAFAQQIKVLRRITHPDYKYPMTYHDVGLIELEQPAAFNQFVQPACLHTTRDIMPSQAQVVGWGLTEKESDAGAKKLNEVTIDILNIERCTVITDRIDKSLRDMLLSENLLDESMICAGVLAGGKDSCSGDSGGPLQINSTREGCRVEVVGIVSFGLGACGAVNTPAVYVRVSHYVPWIQNYTNILH